MFNFTEITNKTLLLVLMFTVNLAYSFSDKNISISLKSELKGICRDSVVISIDILNLPLNKLDDTINICIKNIDRTLCKQVCFNASEIEEIVMPYSDYIVHLTNRSHSIDISRRVDAPISWNNNISHDNHNYESIIVKQNSNSYNFVNRKKSKTENFINQTRQEIDELRLNLKQSKKELRLPVEQTKRSSYTKKRELIVYSEGKGLGMPIKEYNFKYVIPDRSYMLSIYSEVIDICHDNLVINAQLIDYKNNKGVKSAKIEILNIEDSLKHVMFTDSLGGCKIKLPYNHYVATVNYTPGNLIDKYIYLEAPSSWNNYIDRLNRPRSDGSLSRTAPYYFPTEDDEKTVSLISIKDEIEDIKLAIRQKELLIKLYKKELDSGK